MAQWNNGYWVGGLVVRVVADALIDGFVIWLVVRWIRNGMPRFWK